MRKRATAILRMKPTRNNAPESRNVTLALDCTVRDAAFAYLAEIEPWIQQRQIEVTAVSAPTHYEGLRAEWILRTWTELGLRPVLDAAGNVLAERPGASASAPLLAVTAHMDTAFAPGTVARPERRDGRIWAPGIGDNGAGLAAQLALIRTLADQRLRTPAPLLFVANVGEEGEGDLKGMRHLFAPLNPYAARIGWTLVVDGTGSDQITTQALPSRRFKVTFTGPGGHSWSDLGQASAVHAAVRSAAALLAQVKPEAERLGCNIGLMQGGSAVNAIAAEAQIKIDLRAAAQAGVDELTQAVRRAVASGVEAENAAALHGCTRASLEVLGERPGGELPTDSPWLGLVQEVDRQLGIVSHLQRASTDANIPLAQGRPALRLGAGGRGGGAHTLQEWFDPVGRTQALQRLLWVVLETGVA